MAEIHQTPVENGQRKARYPFIFMSFRSGAPLAMWMAGGDMKSKLLAVLLLAGSSLVAAPRVVVGIGLGVPPPIPVAAYVAPAPGPGYARVGGYWYPAGARYAWHAGYWARPPYSRAYWVAPRYFGHRYYRGYWRR
jgi:hypothetical protein